MKNNEFKPHNGRSNILEQYQLTNHMMNEKCPFIEESVYKYMEPEDQLYYDKLPENITIFRGCRSTENSRLEPYGQSWTTSLKVASFFAHEVSHNDKYRHFIEEEDYDYDDEGNPCEIEYSDMVVLTVIIPKKYILGYTNSRKEFEVIVDISFFETTKPILLKE